MNNKRRKTYPKTELLNRLQLYKDRDLVEEAIPILMEEIGRRGCAIPSEDEVRQYTIEREKTTAKKKVAIGSAITCSILLFFYLLFQNGGYEHIRDEWFPNMAAKAYIKEGIGLSQIGNHAKALESYGKARACTPGNSDVYLALASAYMGLGRFTDAVACCQRAIEIKPDSGYAYGGLAAAYDLLRDYDKATLCAEKSLALFEQGLDSENAGKAKALLVKIHKDREDGLHR